MRGFQNDGAEVKQYHALRKQDFIDLLKGRQLQDPKRLQTLQHMAKVAAALPRPIGVIRF